MLRLPVCLIRFKNAVLTLISRFSSLDNTQLKTVGYVQLQQKHETKHASKTHFNE